jgi:hypothetical protein
LVLAFVLLGTEPTLAAAQTAGATSPASEDAASRADALFKAANDDLAKQKWAEAEAKLLAAFALNRSYDIAANLGNTQYRLGKYRDAAEHLAFAVRSWPVIGKREQREFSAKRLAEARKFVASVTIRVSSPGAKVLIDGREVGLTPLDGEVFVEPGTHAIEAKLAGYAEAKQTIEAVKGGAQEMSLMLTPVAQAASASDSEQVAPPVKSVTAETTQGNTRDAPSSGVRPLVIGGLVTAGVLVVAGAAFAGASNAHASDAEEQRTAALQRGVPYPCRNPEYAQTCAEYTDTLTAQRTFANLSVTSFALGGVMGAATAIYALVVPAPKAGGHVRAVPVATTVGGGLMIARDCFWDRFGSAVSGGGAGGDGGVNIACVPSANAQPVDVTCGVFAAKSGSDTNAGTKESPVATLAKAVELAKKESGRVYACAEIFEEALVVDGAVEIYGGLDCGSAWSYRGAEKKTTLTAGADEIPLRIRSVATGSRVEDFAIIAADERGACAM